MPVSANLDKALDKQYENLPLSEVLDAPVAALAGVSDKDAELLKQAFNIKTVRDLGTNKYFRTAAALADLNTSAPSLPGSCETPGVSTGFLTKGGIGDPCVRVHPV